MEAMTGWREGKPWEIAWGELPWGRSETEATTGWTEGKPWEIAWGELGFSGQCHCPEKLRAQDFSSGLQSLGDGTCIVSLAGSDTKNALLLARVFQETNFINTIVPKNCAPKTCQSFQTLGHGTCIASLAGSETKRTKLLVRIFRTNSINAIVPKDWCQRLLKRC